MHNIGMWNGSTWSTIGNIEGAMMGETEVSAMCVYKDHLYIGGNFGMCNSIQTNNISIWDGAQWSAMGTGMNGMVNSLVVYNNELYIAGSFTNAAGVTANNIAKYTTPSGIQTIQTDGQALSLFPNPATTDVTIHAEVGELSAINIEVFDVLGRPICIVNDEHLTGNVAMQFSTTTWQTGNYILRMRLNGEIFTRKLVVVH